ncbi:MAG: DNA polymerase III [Candidatus Levybacteria bacterium]|nr:DNA polymerase III [Candidatus Levybacteria bacterium]
MSNQQVAKLFRNIAAAYTIKDDKKFRFQILAYQKAAETIANSPIELSDLYHEGKLESMPSIGATLKDRLEELFKKGHVDHFDFVLKGIPEAIFTLIDIPKFGPKTAYRLAIEFSLKNSESSVEELIKLAQEGKIAKLEGFGEKSQKDLLQSLIEYKKGKNKSSRMVLPFAYEIAENILKYLKESKHVTKVFPLGSLRRMKPTIGDVDIAVASDNPKEVISHFVNYPYKDRVIEKGDVSASILASNGKQIDLMVQPTDRFGALLQHFTGSKEHNVHLREYALKKGLSLSERGIKHLKINSNDIAKYDTEEKFYNALGLQWIPPEMREDSGEIELASQHKLPKIIELSDIKGDFHLHSNFSIEPSHDLGQSTFEEMIKKAISLNYEYMGFSEHNPSISKHTKQQIYSLIQKRNEKINQLQSNNKNIRIFKFLEIDILSSGDLAVDNRSLDLLDGAIVSIHSSFGTNKKDMTNRIIQGLSHPKAKILAHPTGRILNVRPGYELDFEKIFTFCKENNKALEINAWPTRLDLTDSVVRLAIEAGVKLIIDTDSHEASQMSLMKHGVAMARRGWATKNDIINSLRYNDIVKWLKK